MQGTTIRLLAGGLLMLASACSVQAEALQPDPAWQQGTLANGFQWQVLATPQRPSDRVQIRLSVDIGSLNESTQQAGYSRLIPHIALMQKGNLPTTEGSSLWQQSIDPQHPLPPAIVSYDYTRFNLSLPNNRSDLQKEALTWLASSMGSLAITPDSVNYALGVKNKVMTWPMDTKDSWWRYRLKGSTLLGHDPAESPKLPVDAASLASFYQQWYTPDAMTLIVVGHVDSRVIIEQINKIFGGLKGKRETPAVLPTLSPLHPESVSIVTDSVHQARLSIMWDTPWQPIRESAALLRYWRADLAREALFWHIQQKLSSTNAKDIGLSFDCRVLYLRAQCGLNLDSPDNKMESHLGMIARELASVRDNGLSADEFDALIVQKKLELQKLFTTYARMDTDVLMSQRIRSLQNQVVDISPEQYQKLRQGFLDSLTLEALNQDLRQQLSLEMALILQQPTGEPELNIKALQSLWEQSMQEPKLDEPVTSGDGTHQEVTDIPPAQ